MTGRLSIVRTAVAPKGLSARVAVGGPQAASPDDVFVVVHAEGYVSAFCGHVDLGTGIRTALAQIVAEELDVPFSHVTMVLGDTDKAPDQGATIASETIQVTAVPLRQAAALARLTLLRLAAEAEDVPVAMLDLRDGLVVGLADRNEPLPYGALLAGRTLVARIDETVPLKDPSTYRVVGQPVARVDIPDKATGRAIYVHDVRMDGMLHGRVVRPPYGGLDHGPFFGRSLLAIEPGSIADIAGLVDVVVINDFVGIVAEREEQAVRAADRLLLSWSDGIVVPDLSDLTEALRDNPSTPREVFRKGDVDGALAVAPERLQRSYLWPYQMHASIGPSCAVADWRDDRLVVWSGTQNPHMLRADIALLMGMAEAAITIIRHEAAGCYGRNCADDVSGDAALLSRAVGRPVRVQLSREQEHVWEPKGAAQLMEVTGAPGADGSPGSYDFSTRYPSNVSPLLALVLTGVVPAVPVAVPMGDRTSVPPYAYAHARVTVHDMPPIARASWFRGVSALPNSFAHDCFIDELAFLAGEDPVAYRLRHLPDPRAVALLTAVAGRADWTPIRSPPSPDPEARRLRGRGVAYAQYMHGTFPGVPAAWCAWIADVEVDRLTGQVAVTRVVVGHDAGMMVNPDGVRHQIHGNVIQATSRVLKEEVTFDQTGVSSRDWGTYPILPFTEIPKIDVLMLQRQDQPPMGAGESASVPSAAAIANAIFAATGVRFRTLPFTPDRIKAGLDAALPPIHPSPPPPPPALRQAANLRANRRRRSRGRARGGAVAAACAVIGGLAVALLPWRPEIARIARPDPGMFSDATIARGKVLAAVGDCAVCHTAPGGTRYAGGLELETDFGTIVTTNITPDEETGLGAWSYPAFARAMREGIGRDGRHLYPAFPYTAFAKIDEPDMQALYAYIMSLDPVRHAPPATKLAFPFNIRAAMAGWNALYQDRSPFTPDPSRSAEWNRGAYLAEGVGHCSACHSPRNALGAERAGVAYLGGGHADGWDAPALSSLSRSPVPWTEAAVFDYLRTGFSAHHGPAAGPMAPVVAEMRHLPDADVRAIATYAASFDGRTAAEGNDALAARLNADASARLAETAGSDTGARVFSGSCAACHEGAAPHMFGHRPSLALNSNVFSSRPDNLIRVVLDGAMRPALSGTGTMPAFGNTLNDGQVAALLRYVRATFAPGQPPWRDLEATIGRLRQIAPH